MGKRLEGNQIIRGITGPGHDVALRNELFSPREKGLRILKTVPSSKWINLLVGPKSKAVRAIVW